MSTKTCKKCGTKKPLTEYFKNKRSIDGYLHACKPCHMKRTHDNRDLVRRYKVIKGCNICGYNKHPVALHLNHIDPETKAAGIVDRAAVNYDWSRKRVKEEVRKCEVLCANCHAIKTHEEKHYTIWRNK